MMAALAALVALLALAGPAKAQAATAPCGATFSVLHNDRIGALKVPAGAYDITLIQPRKITCARPRTYSRGFFKTSTAYSRPAGRSTSPGRGS